MEKARKILAVIVMVTMVSAGLIIISPNSTVIAEDSSQQFAMLMDGYPNDELDQNMGSHNTQSTISTAYLAQTFRPGVSGLLTGVDFVFWYQSFPQIDMYMGIWETSAGQPTTEICTEIIPNVVMPGTANWVSVDVSDQPYLTSGTQYAIVIKAVSNSGFWKRYSGSDLYVDGQAMTSGDGGASWTLVDTDYAFSTYMSHSGTGLKKVAWHGSGEYALAVNGVDDTIYKFDRQSSAWSVLGNPNPFAVFNDITYDPAYNEFYLAGEDTDISRPLVYTYNGFGFSNMGSPSALTGKFHAITAVGGDTSYKFLAVGERTGGWGYAAWYRDGWGWLEVSTGWSGVTSEILYDITWNQQTGAPNNCYAVGEDGNMHGFVFRFPLGTTTALKDYSFDNLGQDLEPQRAIAWNPNRVQGVEYDYALIGADMFMGYGSVLKFNGSSSPSIVSDITDTIHDIAWKPDGEMAILAGEDSGGMAVAYYHPSGTEELLSQDMEAPPIYGVAFKGYTSPSSAIMVSSGGSFGAYPSATDIGTTITVNSAFPHSFDVDMWKMADGVGGSSKLNAQVNVEATYTFMTEVNYTVNGIDQFYADAEDDVRLRFYAWYDGGVAPSGSPPGTDVNRNKLFRVDWSEGAAAGADTATIGYPTGSPGTDEVLLDSWWLDPSAPGDHYYIMINVTFGPQMRAADGNGFGNGASSNINVNGDSLNDPGSWDFYMQIYDFNYADATNYTFEEFGIFRFTNITASGDPGGNAPPGSANVALGNSQIQVSSNIPYYVNVSIPRLNKTTDNTKFIPAANVNVSLTSAFANNTNTQMNGSWGPNGRAFVGANQQLGVWGNTSQAASDWIVAAPLNSTTAHGPQGEDFQTLGATQIDWWVSVPGGTSEGIYQATITFRIGYY